MQDLVVPPHNRPWWVGSVLLAGVAVGNWMRDPIPLWAVVAIVGLLGSVALTFPWRGWKRGALGLTAVGFASALFLHQVRLYQLRAAWPDELERQIVSAADLSRIGLKEAFDRAEATATAALSAADLATPASFALLTTIARDQRVETGVAVLETDGAVYAWAGRHRVMPTVGADTLALRKTPYFAVLLSRKRSISGRIVVASVLLDARVGVPERPSSMASRFAERTGVGLEVHPPGAVADSLDPFDYRVPVDTGLRTLYTVRFLPPTQGAAMEVALEDGNHQAVWWLVAVIGLALLVAGGPAERFLLLTVLLWVGVRAPAGEALGLDTLFSPSVFFPGRLPDRSLFGPFSRSAGLLMLSSLLVGVMAIYAWRRALPRSPVGVLFGALLLLGAPFIVQDLGRGITPPAAGVTTGLWLAWHATLLLATSAMLLLASASFRGGATPHRRWPAWLGIVAAVLATGVGLVAFAGRSGWPDWYWVLWAPPLILVTLPAPRRTTVMAIAFVAGSASALVTWAAEVEGRVELARQDYFTLGTEPDPLAEPTLSGFADRLGASPTLRDETDLYSRWVNSALDEQGYPADLALWRPDGTRFADLRLSLVDVPEVTLSAMVAALADSVQRQIVPLARSPGVHYVLVERLDSTTLVTAVIGPRTVLIGPSRLGRLLSDAPVRPLYRMLVVPTPTTAPPDQGRERWSREGWLLRAERIYDLQGTRRLIQAVVDLGEPALLLVRGALVLFLDVVLVALLWLLGELVAGVTWARPDWLTLRRSFRVRLGVALAGFFLAPAVGFAVWSFARLRQEAVERRDLVIAELLRDATSGLTREYGPDLGPRLAARSDRIDAELGYYRHGALIAASTQVLPDLGLLDPLMNPRAYQAIGSAGETTQILGSVSGPQHRTGYRVFRAPGETDLAMVAIRLPAGDPELLGRAFDVAMVLLLATLLAMLAATAGAQVAARSLSRPVRDLRDAALRFGRGLEVAPPDTPPPVEFAPVFAAFDRMVEDVRASRTALEGSRRQTAAVLSTVATGVVGLDDGGHVLIANRRASALLGVELVEGALLPSVLPVAWHELGRRVESALGVLDAAPMPVELEANGQRLSVVFARLDGPRPGLVMAITDITDVARAARVLAWGEMANQVAHEIKNPLTPMRLGIQHLQRVFRDGRERFGETLEETSRRILGEIDRLDTIARAFSRYAAPSEETRPLESVWVAEVAEEVLQFYRLAPGDTAITMSDGGSEPIAARRDEVKEVLINLLENARSADAVRIVVEVADLGFAVRDDGVGIPADHLPRIFEPRFSTTTSGSGLGLAIVRRLVEGWGGRVDVESMVGEGTVVRVQATPPGALTSPGPTAP